MKSQLSGNAAPLSKNLPGTWRLVSRIDLTREGKPLTDPALGSEPIALLFYDRSGHFAAQFMKRDRGGPIVDGPAGAGNNTRAQGGYDAYFGTYTVDDESGVVVQTLDGALSQANVGSVLSRSMTVEGDALVISLETASWDGTPVTRTLTWTRVG
jgi:hypothetical protein